MRKQIEKEQERNKKELEELKRTIIEEVKQEQAKERRLKEMAKENQCGVCGEKTYIARYCANKHWNGDFDKWVGVQTGEEQKRSASVREATRQMRALEIFETGGMVRGIHTEVCDSYGESHGKPEKENEVNGGEGRAGEDAKTSKVSANPVEVQQAINSLDRRMQQRMHSCDGGQAGKTRTGIQSIGEALALGGKAWSYEKEVDAVFGKMKKIEKGKSKKDGQDASRIVRT